MHWEAKAGGEQIREGAELATMEYGWRWMGDGGVCAKEKDTVPVGETGAEGRWWYEYKE
jgi:hypothetical protein